MKIILNNKFILYIYIYQDLYVHIHISKTYNKLLKITKKVLKHKKTKKNKKTTKKKLKIIINKYISIYIYIFISKKQIYIYIYLYKTIKNYKNKKKLYFKNN